MPHIPRRPIPAILQKTVSVQKWPQKLRRSGRFRDNPVRRRPEHLDDPTTLSWVSSIRFEDISTRPSHELHRSHTHASIGLHFQSTLGGRRTTPLFLPSLRVCDGDTIHVQKQNFEHKDCKDGAHNPSRTSRVVVHLAIARDADAADGRRVVIGKTSDDSPLLRLPSCGV